MKLFIISILSVCMLLAACNSSVKSDNKQDTQAKTDSASSFTKPEWVKSPRLTLAINTLLSHKNDAFQCDSAIILSYNGTFGGHTYFPINKKGHLITTITNRKKLTSKQVKAFNRIVGYSGSFKKALNMGCFEPKIGVLYFKDGMVIAQSAISLDCAMMKSTAKLGSNDHYASFNKKALTRLEEFYDDVKL